jgi:acyl-CoA thioester hydrolase
MNPIPDFLSPDSSFPFYNDPMPAFHFHYPIEIRYADLDPQGHVNNARFLTYFEQARVNYLIHLKLFTKDQSFLEIGIIIAEATVTFKTPVYFGTEARVGVRISRLGTKSLTMEYEMADAAGKVYATGSTTIVTFDYNAHATIPIPQEWREKINQFENQ